MTKETSKTPLSRRQRQIAVGGQNLLAAALANQSEGTRKSYLSVAAAQKAAVEGMPPDPIKKAMLMSSVPVFSLFSSPPPCSLPEKAAKVRADVLTIVRHYAQKRRFYDKTGAIHPALLRNLRQVGFFGFSIPEGEHDAETDQWVDYGGCGANFQESIDLMVEIGKLCPSLPPYFSVTAVIGIVGALLQCGTIEQKRKWLPLIARGKALSCFAATENGKGCDVTNCEARGIVEVTDGVIKIDATKMFITLAAFTASEVAFEQEDIVESIHYSEDDLAGKADGDIITFTAEFFKLRTGEINAAEEEILRDVVAIIELPRENGPTFALNDSYRLKALHPRTPNKGIWMRGFKVPVGNLLAGDGLTTIFRDLNAGRFYVATGVGMLQRHLLSAGATWVPERRGVKDKTLDSFQKVRASLATMAARIAGTDALTSLAASLEDRHIANEVVSMIAKVAASNWGREAVTKHALEQHGGRSLIDEHVIPQLLWEFIVACVYEGPNSVLDMAAFERLAGVIRELALDDLFVGLARAGVDMLTLFPDVDKTPPAALKFLAPPQLVRREKRAAGGSKPSRFAKLVKAVQKKAKAMSFKLAMKPVMLARKLGALLRVLVTVLLHSVGILMNAPTIIPAATKLARLWLMYRRPVKADLEGQNLNDLFTCDSAEFVDLEVVRRFSSHLNQALSSFGSWRKGLFGMMVKYGKKLADKQLLLHYDGYQTIETTVALFAAITSASKAARAGDVATLDALDLQCELLCCELKHRDPTSSRIAALVDRVYDHIKNGRFHQLHSTTVYPMVQPAVDRATFDKIMDAVAAGEPFSYPISQEAFPYEEWLQERGGRHGYGPIDENNGPFHMDPPRRFG